MEEKITKMEVCWKDDVLCIASWGKEWNTVSVTNLTGKLNVFAPYIMKDGKNYTISISDLDKFLETRCVPRTREGIEGLLRYKYNLRFYSPLGICMQTHGLSMSDFLWLRFNDEKIGYDDVKIR